MSAQRVSTPPTALSSAERESRNDNEQLLIGLDITCITICVQTARGARLNSRLALSFHSSSILFSNNNNKIIIHIVFV